MKFRFLQAPRYPYPGYVELRRDTEPGASLFIELGDENDSVALVVTRSEMRNIIDYLEDQWQKIT